MLHLVELCHVASLSSTEREERENFLLLFSQVDTDRPLPTHVWNCVGWRPGHPDSHGLHSAQTGDVPSAQHLIQSVSITPNWLQEEASQSPCMRILKACVVSLIVLAADVFQTNFIS